MRLREALDLCTHAHADDWAAMPGSRPATSMLAGLFDPGMAEARTRPLVGHTIAVYEPEASLSLVWPVPDEDEADGASRHQQVLPEWAEQDSHDWKARSGWAIVLLGGAPIWQTLVWYLDWGSGVGGYVSDLQPVFGEGEPGGGPSIEGWETSEWAVGLARLLSYFSATGDFLQFDPTPRLVPSPSPVHPVDAVRQGR